VLALLLVAGAGVAYVGLRAGERSEAEAPSARHSAVPAPSPHADDEAEPQRLRARVLATFPHDRSSYTQGLLRDGDDFVESAGGYGSSLVRRWRPGAGRPLAQQRLPDSVFAEGIAMVGESLIQLTWREGIAYYRDRRTLAEQRRVRFQGEGWGLCWDGERLLMSDGSDLLIERDPESFTPLRRISVRIGEAPLPNLNELECAEGWVYANVYETDQIARIDPVSGLVTALIDASGLLTPKERAAGAEVLNGIAYNPGTETFYLTGKWWPRLFEVVFEPVAAGAAAVTPMKSTEGARS
jgi:glutaminyl-peptide cyclotransferase